MVENILRRGSNVRARGNRRGLSGEVLEKENKMEEREGVGEEVGEGGVKGKDLKADDALRSDIKSWRVCNLLEDETYLECRRREEVEVVREGCEGSEAYLRTDAGVAIDIAQSIHACSDVEVAAEEVVHAKDG